MITHLTLNGVSILNAVDGVNCRKAYINNETGRQALQAEQPDEIVNEIMKVWDADQEDTANHTALEAGTENYREKNIELRKEFDSLKERLIQCIKDLS